MSTVFSAKEIVEIFSYSAEEQSGFDYLHRYMKRVNKKLPEIEADKEKLKRFALAGLFLTYRAFNHQGSEMTTNVSDISFDNIDYKRLGVFKDYFGTEIKDTSHYLSMINFSAMHYILVMFKMISVSRKLYYFVCK